MQTTMARCVLGAILCAASCDGGTAPSSAEAKKEASAKPSEGDKGEAKAEAEPAKADSPASAATYSAPKDICALPNLSLLGESAGKPGDGYAENETGDLPTPGCAFDLVGDSVNTFKLFVNVDKASDRYALMVESMELASSAGFVTEEVTGLGSKALYAVQQSAENRKINASLAVLDGNLFVEARLIAGGIQPWDSKDVKDRLTKLVREVVGKIPKT